MGEGNTWRQRVQRCSRECSWCRRVDGGISSTKPKIQARLVFRLGSITLHSSGLAGGVVPEYP
jgi:hypothetical protein